MTNHPMKGIIMFNEVDDDIWAESWLDRNYGGAPDECSACFRNGEIVKIDNCKENSHK